MQAPWWIRRSIDAIESNPAYDRLGRLMGPAASKAGEGRAGSILRGEWLGHALHPLLTDLPIGCWYSATVLDLVGGKRSRPAARRLVGLGVAFVPVVAASGYADYDTIEGEREARVGAVHAAGNAVAGYLYYRSWRHRRKGRHLRGVVLALAGGGLVVVTGYLGGHLSFARGTGVGPRGLDDDAFVASGTAARSVDADALMGLDEVATVLTVAPTQVRTMVDEGLLTPAGGGDQLLFTRAEVMAVRLQGG